jgi:predicted kinase
MDSPPTRSAIAPLTPQTPTPRIVLTVGLPGSGKSTWLSENRITPLSSDSLRKLLLDDEDDQTENRVIFLVLRSLLKKRIELKRPVTYVDATHLSTWERRPYLEIAKLQGCDVEALFFDEPLDLCLERNANRSRVVPADVMHRMAQRLQPPTLEEGFSRIVVIRGRTIRNIPPELQHDQPDQ